MSRTLTKKEKMLLLGCIVMIIAIFYYQFVWKSTSIAMKEYDNTLLEEELLIAETKVAKLIEMEKFLEQHKDQPRGMVVDYNNLQNEITELNEILKEAYTYQLNFEDATTDGHIVRRDVYITFETGNYTAAKNILQSLKDSRYKCLLRDITIIGKEKGLQTSELVNTSLKVTFYEAVTEAVSIADLPGYTDTQGTQE